MTEIGERLMEVSGWAIRLVVAALVFMVMYVIMVSLVSDVPFRQKEAIVIVNHNKSQNTSVLMEIRTMQGLRKSIIGSAHKLYRKGHPEDYILIDGTSFSSMPDDFRVASSTVIPGVVQGEWCVAVEYSWWPTLSQRQFTMSVDDICFETTEYD